jgi:hypothetical protein
MSPETIPDAPALLACKIKVPQHVVYRSFPTETVVLNLQTGRYHGLNATAGGMLSALEHAASVHDAAVTVAAEYEQPQPLIEHDMCTLCSVLLERGLIELDDRAGQ